MFNNDEVAKYHARYIKEYCKEHKCEDCIFSDKKDICYLITSSPLNWIGIEEGDD